MVRIQSRGREATIEELNCTSDDAAFASFVRNLISKGGRPPGASVGDPDYVAAEYIISQISGEILEFAPLPATPGVIY